MKEITYFAPASRSRVKEIEKDFDLLSSQEFFNEIFSAIQGIGAILDKNRQIIYANSDLMSFLWVDNLETILKGKAAS